MLSEDRAELIVTAASDSSSIHRGEAASVELAGNSHQVQLPGCEAAGFRIADNDHIASANGSPYFTTVDTPVSQATWRLSDASSFDIT